ncbi:MAG TPA: S41 family peptidase [Pyrinomonadaceae bacterium]|nr:S41 family peptidase [Chloracidobacterium sp.]HRJ89290.1 S41 family peptidase [Pyrinomonadaceae bacterium]HRK51647.1 S41 family peptidase [Pyrinomonadaceae bacterium]
MILAAILLAGTPAAAAAQSPEDAPVSDLPVVEPFKLSPGSSFSAANGGDGWTRPQPNAKKYEMIVDDLREALEIIEKNRLVSKKDGSGRLVRSAIESMLHSLDPHSNFYDASEFAELIGEHQNEYFGTGSTITNYLVNGLRETFIIAVAPNTPASAAGLRFGDRIVAVDGVKVPGLSSMRVREMVRGRLGTIVKITVERAASGLIETIAIKRDRVPQLTVPNAFVVGDGVGYIEMSVGFSFGTPGELDKALSDLRLRGITSLILDLRGNTGGIVDSAAAVADRFLPDGALIATQRGRYPIDERIWRSTNKSPIKMPMVVLVDGDTASAAEIVAGAMQDNDRALIAGTKTFGKGLVQNVLELSNGAGLTLTAARYYTPAGRSIQRDYSDGSMYDYFSQTHRADLIDRSVTAVKTLTDRTVYGGDGIAPDIDLGATQLTRDQAQLIDPLFFFVRDLINDRADGKNRVENIRQRFIFGENVVDDKILADLAIFLDRQYGRQQFADLAEREGQFVRSQLRYDLALATFGLEMAGRQQVMDDLLVKLAIENIGRSDRLATEAARAFEIRRAKEKRSLSKLPNELR